MRSGSTRVRRAEGVWVVVLMLVCIALIAYVDGVVRPGYWLKTLCKAPLFLCVPLVFARVFGGAPFAQLRPSRKGLRPAILLGLGVFGVVLGAYFLLNALFDLSSIRTALVGNLGIDSANFWLIAAYVALCNSFLEEWFFRGFVFMRLRPFGEVRAHALSALGFAGYHIAIIDGMFSPPLLALMLFGLVVGGCIFNALRARFDSLYAPWFCHMFANFAINLVGVMVLFG